jgi:hypothetical protein
MAPRMVQFQMPQLPRNLPRAIYCASGYSVSSTNISSHDVFMHRVCVFTQATGHYVSSFLAKVRGNQPSFGVLCMHVVEIGRANTSVTAAEVYLYKVSL